MYKSRIKIQVSYLKWSHWEFPFLNIFLAPSNTSERRRRILLDLHVKRSNGRKYTSKKGSDEVWRLTIDPIPSYPIRYGFQNVRLMIIRVWGRERARSLPMLQVQLYSNVPIQSSAHPCASLFILGSFFVSLILRFGPSRAERRMPDSVCLMVLCFVNGKLLCLRVSESQRTEQLKLETKDEHFFYFFRIIVKLFRCYRAKLTT